MLRNIIPALGALMVCGAAFAQPAPEIEPNGLAPGTPAVPPGLPYYAIIGDIVPGDVDFHDCGPVFPFPLIVPVPGALISAATWTDIPGAADTYIGAFLPAAAPPFVSVDDDDNVGLNSAHHFSVPFGPPPLAHVVTGFPDFGFTGAHGIATPYCLVVSNTGIPEAEFNDVIPAANPLPPFIFATTAAEGMLAPGPVGVGDVDMYSTFIAAGAWVTYATYDFSAPPLPFPAMDTYIGVFDPTGALVVADDDSGPALLSAVSFVAPFAGVYTFAVTGFPDVGFVGAHGMVGPYRAVVAVCADPVVVGCDSIDFNADGLFPDTLDVDDFLSVFGGGLCSNDPFCGDMDFNNDGLFPDTLDIDSLLSVFSGGPCL